MRHGGIFNALNALGTDGITDAKTKCDMQAQSCISTCSEESFTVFEEDPCRAGCERFRRICYDQALAPPPQDVPSLSSPLSACQLTCYSGCKNRPAGDEQIACMQYCDTEACQGGGLEPVGPEPTTPFVPQVPIGPCNSAPVIAAVQAQIGTVADGKWGPNSRKALAKTGKTFTSFAPGCTGAIPNGGGGGGGTTTSKKTPGTTTPAKTGPGTVTASMFSSPMIWIGLAALAVGGVLIFGGRK